MILPMVKHNYMRLHMFVAFHGTQCNFGSIQETLGSCQKIGTTWG